MRAISAPPSRPAQLMRIPERTEPQGRLHRTLHGAPERHPALELLRDGLGDERRVDLGLPHLEDVEMHLGRRQLGELAAHLLDVGALLADQHAGPRGVHGDAALLVRALDHHLGDAAGAALLEDMVANAHVLVQQTCRTRRGWQTSGCPTCD